MDCKYYARQNVVYARKLTYRVTCKMRDVGKVSKAKVRGIRCGAKSAGSRVKCGCGATFYVVCCKWAIVLCLRQASLITVEILNYSKK